MKRLQFLLYQIYYLFADFSYDFVRYVKYSMLLRVDTFNKLESRIMANAHVIEKGLALPHTKVKFGTGILQTLLSLLNIYIQKGYPKNNYAFQSAIGVLIAYRNFHLAQNITISPLFEKIAQIENNITNSFDSMEIVRKAHLDQQIKGDYKSLAFARHTIRNFSHKKVDQETLDKAISVAISTPSVCNRQSWKVYATTNNTKIKNALKHQTGNRGFGDKLPCLLILTGDLNTFQGFQERNQVYVDGGLFAMNLIHSLLYYGLGSCPLNWSAHFDRDLAIRKVVPIPPNETIIMLMGIGYLPDSIKTTASLRKDTTAILVTY